MRDPIIVLKFGSSVLGSEADLPAAILEIYREIRRGHRVLAVVSAFGNTTDELLTRARESFGEPEPASLARLLATGEAESAATLGLALDQAGIPCEILDAARIGLRTRGPLLDSEPEDLARDKVRDILAQVPVAVVPGFLGRDTDGRCTLLGRGGSDLTALFLAQRLEAVECRLLKDVDGLLQVHPDGSLNWESRYATAHYDECLRVGGPLIQPKAVEFAARHQLSFGIARCGSSGGTLAGPFPSRFETVPARPRRLRVALAGLGSVGLGVYRWLQGLSDDFEVASILVGDPTKARPGGVPADLLTTEPKDLLTPAPDLLIEVIGGTDTAGYLIKRAIDQGIPVVSANKQLLALEPELLRTVTGCAPIARDAGSLTAAAAVGGSLPVLERTTLLAADEPIVAVEGILNGTCNYILDRMHTGLSLDTALGEAQDLGLAEADPTLDVSGLDCVYKLALLASTAFGQTIGPKEIVCEGLENATDLRLQETEDSEQIIKLVAEARREGGRIRARVGLRAITAEHSLADCLLERNRLVVETASGRRVVLDGRGAGRWPTTVAVLSDALAQRRRLCDPGLTASVSRREASAQ